MKPSQTDWSSVFDCDDYLYFYSQAVSEDITSEQVAFITDILQLAAGSTILDLACGHGRHANQLAQQGYKVTGVDISGDFLAIARREARDLGLDVQYLQQDLRQLSLSESFDAVLSLFTSFGYFEHDENIQLLARVRNSLKPGGRFILDLPSRDGLMAAFRPFTVVEKGNDLMAEQIKFDPVDGTLHNHRILVRDGNVRKVDFSLHLYNASQVREMLQRVGFTQIAFYENWKGDKLRLTSPRQIVVAQAG